ncbi:MAG: M16 family metallopeptidase [Gemmatimonadota bacterium]|nr:insulinase family protein [Gemmatimonadota bacterium]
MKVGTTERKRRGWRRATLAALLGLVLLPLATPGEAQSRKVLERVLRREVLSNGLEVIVVENHAVPLVTLEVDVRNGAFTQTAETEGLAHLYEHMFFKANASWPDADDFLGRASELGARFNATTQEERVNYYLTVPRDSMAGALQFLAAALRAPLFRADELAREREVVLGEYDRNESSPFFALQQAMGRLLYGREFARKNTIGNREVIRTATPEQMRAIQQRYYVPNNCALIVAGDVVPDSVFALARRLLGNWPRQPDPFAAAPVPPLPPFMRDTAVIIEAPVSAITVLVQWNGPSVRRDPTATYAADVFSDALNQPGSALQRQLVDSGLWQGFGVNYYTLDQTGPITLSGQTTVENFRAAMRALDEELAKFDDLGYIRPVELEHVKASRRVTSAFGLERASDLSHTIGFWWAVASLDYFLGYVDNMAAQTLADLQRYARTYIVGRPRLVGVLISPEDRAKLQLKDTDLTGGRGR